MKRLCGGVIAGLIGGGLVWSAVTMPPPSLTLDVPLEQPGRRPVVRGVYHVHSTESDGTGSVAYVAESARRAGLDFVILTDHSDGSRHLRAPRYYGGVLCLEAIEISTDDGHYAALGLDQVPYPLGGAGRDVAEDVARLGGFGVVAHPDSAKPELRWNEWNMPVGGFEWFNADSEWRDESFLKLLPAVVHYLFRKPEAVASLFDRPVEALAAWDRLTARGHVVGMAAADAHARLGFGGSVDPYDSSLFVPIPSYEAMFRAFSLQVDLEEEFEGRAPEDARRLLAAIRRGRVTTSFEAVAAPAHVTFEGEAGGVQAGPGEDLPPATPVTFRVRSNRPPGATTVLLRDGHTVHESANADVQWQGSETGAFRVEIRLPGAPGRPPVPWVVTNPIYVGVPPGPPGPSPTVTRGSAAGLPRGGWAIERDRASQGNVEILSPEGASFLAAFSYRLAPAPVSSPFVAAVTHDVGALYEADRVTFQASATKPMRLSVQLRSSVGGRERRWRRSVYLDQSVRDITVAFADMRGIAEARGAPVPIRDVTSLLFVVDTVNAVPGDTGAVTLVDVRAGVGQ